MIYKKAKTLLLVSFCFLFSFSLISAVTWNVDFKAVNTNASEYWITNEGAMDNVPDLYPTLDGIYVQLGNFSYLNNYTNIAFINNTNIWTANQDARGYNFTMAGINLTNANWGWSTYIDAYPNFVSQQSDYIFYDSSKTRWMGIDLNLGNARITCYDNVAGSGGCTFIENLTIDANVAADWGNFNNLNITGKAYIGDLTWNGNLDLDWNNITNVSYINGVNFSLLNITANIWKRVGSTISPLADGDDITTTGTGTFGKGIFDVTDTEALLVRKNADGGDVFTIDTTNERTTVGDVSAITNEGGGAVKNAMLQVGMNDEVYGLKIEQDTSNMNAAKGQLMRLRKYITGSADEDTVLSYIINSRLDNSFATIAGPAVLDLYNAAILNNLDISGAHAGSGLLEETNVAMANIVRRNGIITTNHLTEGAVENIGIENQVASLFDTDQDGDDTIVFNTGTKTSIQCNSDDLGTGDIIVRNVGESIAVTQGSNPTGLVTNIGVFIQSLTGGDVNWGYYNDAPSDNFMGKDNTKNFLGTGFDISTTFNSTDRIVNAEVGTPNAFWTNFGGYYFDNNVEVEGSITSQNVFLPAYIRVPNNRTQTVAVANRWYNVTLDKKQTDTQENINHTWNDDTNDTITINDAGVYAIHYTFSFIDSAPNPDAHIGMRLRKTDNTAVKGSYSEVDTHRQLEEVFNSHGFITKFNAGDSFKIQFTSDDTTVSTYLHSTFESGSVVKFSMHKIANLP